MNDKMKHILFMMMSAVLTASCSQDALDEGQDTALPEGAYPLELTASLTATTSTRATVDGTWSEDAKIAVQVMDDGWDTPAYLYTTDGEAIDPDAMHYWNRRTELLRAWHTGESTSTVLPTSWEVQTQQDTRDRYEQGDFLFSAVTEATYPDKAELTFYHQTAKVTVHIRNTEITATTKPEDVTLSLQNIAITGSFTAPSVTDQQYGTWDTEEQNSKIIPFPLGQQTFINDSQQETSVASFTALVIPQTIAADTQLLGFTMENSTFSYTVPTDGITWQGGNEYTFIITLTADKLVEVEVKGSNGYIWTNWPRWTDGGGSTSGSYEIP